jgi:hypothetical protein
VIALRNFVVHDYDEIDFTIVWNICERHVPELIAFCEPMAGEWVDGSQSSILSKINRYLPALTRLVHNEFAALIDSFRCAV